MLFPPLIVVGVVLGLFYLKVKVKPSPSSSSSAPSAPAESSSSASAAPASPVPLKGRKRPQYKVKSCKKDSFIVAVATEPVQGGRAHGKNYN